MKLTQERLKELQSANLPRLRATDIATIKEDNEDSANMMMAIDEYCRQFVNGDGNCVCCGAQQGARNLVDVLLTARFRWGLVHGEGYCSDCGYPGRAIHHIKGVCDIKNVIWQYHPDELVEDTELVKDTD